MSALSARLSWAGHHPEVAANNEKDPIHWPCEKIDTDLGYCHQPSIVRDRGGALYAEGGDGKIFHSTDGGRSWSRLCQSPPLFGAPDGMKQITLHQCGIGVSDKGTLLVHWRCAYSKSGQFSVTEPTLHDVVWVTRSEDRGESWTAIEPFAPPDGENYGAGKVRIQQMPDGLLLLPYVSAPQSRPGRPITPAEQVATGHLLASEDDGRTWRRFGLLGTHCDETDLLRLPSGRLLAAIRYQRKKLASDPKALISPVDGSPEIGSHSVYKNTAFAQSDDGGKTWSPPLIVTGFVQQTGCLARLSDGTIILPYSRKDGTHGQRFILSYDEGRTWSNAIYELNGFGLFASTTVLDDDTLVTVHETPRNVAPHNWVMLHALKWKAPSRADVEKNGFFTPRAGG